MAPSGPVWTAGTCDGFRDRFETARLQGLRWLRASGCATVPYWPLVEALARKGRRRPRLRARVGQVAVEELQPRSWSTSSSAGRRAHRAPSRRGEHSTSPPASGASERDLVPPGTARPATGDGVAHARTAVVDLQPRRRMVRGASASPDGQNTPRDALGGNPPARPQARGTQPTPPDPDALAKRRINHNRPGHAADEARRRSLGSGLQRPSRPKPPAGDRPPRSPTAAIDASIPYAPATPWIPLRRPSATTSGCGETTL